MKHYKLNNLIENLQRVRMTEDEKSEVLMRAWSSIEQIEAAHEVTARTSRIVEVGHQKASVSTTFQTAWYSYFMEKKFVPALSLAILLIATGGTSLAAESALPGDFLYKVKLGLNEQVRGLTAVTPEAKAKFALEVTDRRLKEVALLSSKGLLNAETSSIIQSELLKQAGQIKNQVASLVSTNNIRSAQEISLNFESSLRAHELILEKISSNTTGQAITLAAIQSSSTESTATELSTSSITNKTGSTTNTLASALISTDSTLNTNIHIASLIATIKAQIATTTAARAMLQAVEAGDSTLDRDKLLARLAEIKFKTIEIKRIAGTSSTSQSPRVTTSLSYITESDNLIATASQKIASSSYASALLDLQKAGEYLVDAETLITAEYASDPSLKSVIEEALSLPGFSQVGTSLEKASSTDSTAATSTVATSTASDIATSTTSN
jgi:hypothetical protein